MWIYNFLAGVCSENDYWIALKNIDPDDIEPELWTSCSGKTELTSSWVVDEGKYQASVQ